MQRTHVPFPTPFVYGLRSFCPIVWMEGSRALSTEVTHEPLLAGTAADLLERAKLPGRVLHGEGELFGRVVARIDVVLGLALPQGVGPARFICALR
jgi:hypothetical protein